MTAHYHGRKGSPVMARGKEAEKRGKDTDRDNRKTGKQIERAIKPYTPPRPETASDTMTRRDGKTYELDGRVIPSRRAMERANEWNKLFPEMPQYDISDYYDDGEPSAPATEET